MDKREYNLSAYILYTVHLLSSKCSPFWWRQELTQITSSFYVSVGEFEEESKQPVLSEQQKHQLKHRELFLSRQFESLPATHIRYVRFKSTRSS